MNPLYQHQLSVIRYLNINQCIGDYIMHKNIVNYKKNITEVQKH